MIVTTSMLKEKYHDYSNPLDKIKSRRKKEEDAVSRKQIAQELEIDEDLL